MKDNEQTINPLDNYRKSTFSELAVKGELTWDEMLQLEPALQALMRIASLPGAGYYRHIKPILLALVGQETAGTRSEWMASSDAYELAVKKLTVKLWEMGGVL